VAKSAGRPPKPSGNVETVDVDLPISVGQFVKVAGLVSTGGEAKMLVGAGEVLVNGEVETRRGHKLTPGDTVSIGGHAARVRARPAVAGKSSPGRPVTPPRG
jgi:ribosome-associated protein